MNIEIKKMETEDEICGKAYVHFKSWHESYSGIIDANFLSGKITYESCLSMAKKYPDNVIVAKDENRVVGFAVFGKCRDDGLDDCGEVYAIYVLEAYQKKKIGYALMNEAMSNLREYKKIALWVFRDNAKAIEFYKRYGFAPDGTENVFTLGTELTEIRMIYERGE